MRSHGYLRVSGHTFFLFVFCLACGFLQPSTASGYATCMAGQHLYFYGGGSLQPTASSGQTCNDFYPQPGPPPSWIWHGRYQSPAIWAGRVTSECDGSKYNNAIGWKSVRACGSPPEGAGWSPGDACIDATFNTNPFLWTPTAALKAYCEDIPKDNCGCGIGKPIQPGSGSKVFVERDFLANNSPLSLTRYYSSFGPQASIVLDASMLGGHWRTNYDRRIYSIDPASGAAVMAVRPDSRVKYFAINGQEITHFNGTPAETVVRSATGGWTYTTGNDEVESYDSTGRLIGLWDKTNLQQTLTYDGQGRLAQVTDARGRSLHFSYTGNIQGYAAGTVTVTLPDATALTYSVDGHDNLISVTYPGSITRQFSYQSVGLLNAVTGITDENGAAYEAIDYDDPSGRALDSYLAPGTAANLIERNSFVYNADGTTTHTDPSGGTQILSFSTTNGVLNFSSLSAPCSNCGFGTTKSRTYDTAGYVQSATDFNGVATNYVYDDARGLETQRVEASGKPEQRTTNTTWNATFHVPNQSSVLNNTGTKEVQTDWTYNSRGQVLTRIQSDPQNASNPVRTWTYTYCESVGTGCPLIGLMLSVDGPRTDVTDTATYSYYQTTDESGCATIGGVCHHLRDLFKITNALGQVTTYISYDKNGRVTRTQDANGVYSDMTYHARGWLLTRTVRANSNGTPNTTLDATTTFAYDNVGNVTRVTQPDAAYLNYGYDNAHRLTDITDNVGDHIRYILDAAGNRTDEKIFDPGSNLKRELTRVYSQLNRLTALKNASGASVQSFVDPGDPGVTYLDGYDGNGNSTYYIDGTANHVGSEQQYDPLNRLAKTLQDHAGTGATHDTKTQYAYDTRDNLRSVTDPNNLSTNYTYDGLNNLTNLSSPDTGSTGYTYDAAGNRKTRTDARGVTSSYSYDALNRVTVISYPTASLNIIYAYDVAATGCFNVGRVTTIYDNSGSTTYCYDQRGNILKKTQALAGSNPAPDCTNGICTQSVIKPKVLSTSGFTSVTTYSYTLADRLASITYPSGAIVAYGRDSVGRIVSVTYKASATAAQVNVLTGVTYYPFGPQNALTFGNGRTLTKAYDNDYAIDKIVSSNANGLVVDATVDVLGNLSNASSAVGAAPPTQQYQYDPLYRLTNVQNGSGTSLLSFSYDSTGDRLSKTPQGQSVQSYTYTPGSHRLASVAGVSRSYDLDGNTTQLNGQTLTYDDRNRFTAQGMTTFDYNGRGERVVKVDPQTLPVSGNIVGTYAYQYLENGSLASEWTQVWVCSAQLAGTQSAPIHNTGKTLLTCPLGQSLMPSWRAKADYIYVDSIPIAYATGGTLYYVETDQLGTPRQLIQPGATTATDTTVWKWDYFASNSAFGENTPSVQTITFNLRFPGQYYDSETGLSYNYAREYEAATGRYAQSDPIGLGGGANTYAYSGLNPLLYFDSSGLSRECYYLPTDGTYEVMTENKRRELMWTFTDPFPVCFPDPHPRISPFGGPLPNPILKLPRNWTPWDSVDFDIYCFTLTIRRYQDEREWQLRTKALLICDYFDDCNHLIGHTEDPAPGKLIKSWWSPDGDGDTEYTWTPIGSIRTY
jgi:RHS repeat-associated protein